MYYIYTGVQKVNYFILNYIIIHYFIIKFFKLSSDNCICIKFIYIKMDHLLF